MRGNAKFLSQEHHAKLQILNCDFFIDESRKIMTVGYQCKKKKKVIILSSLHQNSNVEVEGKKKPEMIKFYNKTKSGVDVLDAMVRLYTTRACSRRWPMAIFYDILDKTALKSWFLYK